MSDLFFQSSDFVSGRTDLPTIQNVQDLIYQESSENDAYGHWIFGVDESSLIDKVNARPLVLQPNATIQPVYLDNAVALGATGNSLFSDLVAHAAINLTMSAVVKISSTTIAILMGNLRPSSNTTSSGQGIFASAGKAYLTVRPLAAAPSGGANSITPNNVLNQTEYFFISASIDKVAKTYTVYAEQVGSANISGSFTSNFENSSDVIAVGNAFYSGSAHTLTFAEAIIHDRALSLIEIQGVASRAKIRSEVRGIIF